MIEKDKQWLTVLFVTSFVSAIVLAVAIKPAAPTIASPKQESRPRAQQKFQIERPGEDDGLRAIQVINTLPSRLPAVVRTTAEQTVAVFVDRDDGLIQFGSGFVLRPTIVVTAAHLFTGTKYMDTGISVICGETQEDGRMIMIDPHADVALIEVDCRGASLSLDESVLREHEDVFLAGYTFTPLPSAMIETKQYFKTARPAPDARLNERPTFRAVHGMAKRGQSGSPIFRENGRIVGMIVATEPKRKLTFFVTAGTIRSSLKRANLGEPAP